MSFGKTGVIYDTSLFEAIGQIKKDSEVRRVVKEEILSEMGVASVQQLSLEKRRLLEAKVDAIIARRGGNGGRQRGVISEAKQKMAEIAKDDIKEQVEKHAIEFEPKPKRKSNPKQMDGIKTEGEFKKTRKKATKKKTK